jgi:hypothetical protein
MTNSHHKDALGISRALAKQAYLDRRIRLVDSDIAGFSHVVSTRSGLFAIAPDRWKRLSHGMFFGLVCRPDALFVFESCDLPRERTALGRVLRFNKTADRLSDGHILVEGLDNGCHQMDLIDEHLVLTDTYNQRLISIPAEGGAPEAIYPLPTARLNDWDGGYHHVNSILRMADHVLLMLHNGAAMDRRSIIAAFDRQWRPVWTKPLPGPGCHDISLDAAGSLVCCNSMAGAVMASDGRGKSVSTMMTRGLSVDSGGIVVGSTEIVRREDRGHTRGMVSFLSPDLDLQTDLFLPSGPTDIRRWDGTDIPGWHGAPLDPIHLSFRLSPTGRK